MILTLLQARVSSSRLPGKVMKPILGRPMLARQVERIRRAEHIGTLVIATSIGADDDPIAVLAEELGIGCARGSLNDVLDRFYQAALPYRPSHVVRLTGDCALADWTVIDRVIAAARDGGADYTTNTLRYTWPDGLDVEVVRFEALETAWREARLPSEREHVTPFIRNNPDRFSQQSVENDEDLSNWRWTVDEVCDFDMVSRVYEALYPVNPAFESHDILRFLAETPAVAALNQDVERNAGYLKAMQQDQEFLRQK